MTGSRPKMKKPNKLSKATSIESDFITHRWDQREEKTINIISRQVLCEQDISEFEIRNKCI